MQDVLHAGTLKINNAITYCFIIILFLRAHQLETNYVNDGQQGVGGLVNLGQEETVGAYLQQSA
tara:strand:- start:368 stop:559 length:192 start_codon:yes stop_codon:yes gene_type:complete